MFIKGEIMADITFPTSAVPGVNPSYINGFANVTLAQGQMVYRNNNKKLALAIANPIGQSNLLGMVASSGTVNTPVAVQTKGRVTGLTGLTPGVTYYLSDTVAGAICLFGDLLTGARVVIAGFAVSATEFEIFIKDTGISIV